MVFFILHVPSLSFVGPKIFLNTFLSRHEKLDTILQKNLAGSGSYWSTDVHGRIMLNLTFTMWRCLLHVVHHTNQWRALVITTVTLPVLLTEKDKFLTSWANIRVSKGLNSMELCYIPKKIDTYNNTRRGGTHNFRDIYCNQRATP